MNHKLIGAFLFLLSATVARAEVVSDSLPDLSLGSLGVETGLNASMWGERPDADTVMKQMAALSEMDMNETERSLFARILMTEAGGVETLNQAGDSFLFARLEALIKQGLFQEVLTVTDRVPAAQQTAEIKKYRAKALFGLGKLKEMCTDDMLSALENDEPFMRVICAESANHPAADLIYDVYRESESDSHPFLDAAGDIIYREIEVPMPDGTPSLFEWPMVAKAYGVDIFEKQLSRGDLLVLVGSENVPHEVRVAAGYQLQPKKEQTPDGRLLDQLGTWITARIELEKSLSLTPEGKTGE